MTILDVSREDLNNSDSQNADFYPRRCRLHGTLLPAMWQCCMSIYLVTQETSMGNQLTPVDSAACEQTKQAPNKEPVLSETESSDKASVLNADATEQYGRRDNNQILQWKNLVTRTSTLQ